MVIFKVPSLLFGYDWEYEVLLVDLCYVNMNYTESLTVGIYILEIS